MPFDIKQKNKIWEKYHGNKQVAYDPFGYYISRDNFEADHIWPEHPETNRKGKSVLENGIPLSKNANELKANHFSGRINNKTFEVKMRTEGIGFLYVNGQKVSID